MIVRRGGRMSDVAEEGVVIDILGLVVGPNVLEAGEQRQVGDSRRSKSFRGRSEARPSLRLAQRELPEGAEAVGRTSLVVRLNDDALIGELRLEMDGLTRRRAEGASERSPVG